MCLLCFFFLSDFRNNYLFYSFADRSNKPVVLRKCRRKGCKSQIFDCIDKKSWCFLLSISLNISHSLKWHAVFCRLLVFLTVVFQQQHLILTNGSWQIINPNMLFTLQKRFFRFAAPSDRNPRLEIEEVGLFDCFKTILTQKCFHWYWTLF